MQLDPQNFVMLSQRQRMSPFPNYMSMESVCKEMEKHVGTKLEDTFLIFEGRIMNAFNMKDAFEKSGRHITDLVHQDPDLYHRLVDRQENKSGPALINFAKQAGGKNLSSLSAQELYELFFGYEKHYKDVYSAYASVWVMEDVLNADLFNIINERLQDPVASSDALNALTRQSSAMVNQIERKALLKIAAHTSEENLDTAIEKHFENFFWVTRDYEDPIMTKEDIRKRLAEYTPKKAKSELEELENNLRESEEKRQSLIKELKLTQEEQALFAAMRDAAHLKELRKRHVSESLYYFDPVLEETAKRLYLSVPQVRFMRTSDVYEALVNEKDLTHEINERIKLSVWPAGTGSVEKVVTGEEAQEIYNNFCSVDKSKTEFQGTPVSPGKAKGPAKIVMNPDECDKVEEGDIIVSVQVVPSFSTAIIKAAGLVCDGGHGITSHPATLAREAGIPGVIQTRFVRAVIKDGDMIEVDGYSGVVRKL